MKITVKHKNALILDLEFDTTHGNISDIITESILTYVRQLHIREGGRTIYIMESETAPII